MHSSRLTNAAALLAAALGLISASPPASAQTYRAVNLGQLSSAREYFYATALNNLNVVAGYTLPTVVEPVQWKGGKVTLLDPAAANGAQAFGLNDAGVAVGVSAAMIATSWTNGTATSLGTLAGSSPNATSTAYAINSSGQIVGASVPAPGGNPIDLTAFLYSGGTMTDLNPSSTLDSTATAIDDNGDVVGYVATPNGRTGDPKQAVLWSGGTMTPLPFVAPVDGTTYTAANAINNSLQIAGFEDTPDQTGSAIAVLWSAGSGTPTAAALGGGRAWGINDAGQIVGENDAGHAALWPQAAAQALDLNNLIDPATKLGTLVLLRAGAINNQGAILAIGSSDGGQSIESVLLEPEPLSLALAPATLTFVAQSVGTLSVTQSVAVRNTGTVAFNFSSINISGDYTQTNNCGASLAPAAHCSVVVTFAPTAPGSRAGVLTVTSGGTSYTANLTGTGNISLSFTASATTAAVGAPFTLTWKAPGTTCTASGGTAGDGWQGTLAESGSIPVTESTGGTHSYEISCSGAGQTASGRVDVTVGLPTVSLRATPTQVAFGHSTTLTWTSAFASSCTASGGATGDSWAGSRATSGSKAISESASGSYSYTLTCGTGSITAHATATVSVAPIPSAPSRGGGGGLDRLSLGLLLAMLALEGWHRVGRPEREAAARGEGTSAANRRSARRRG